MKPKLKPPGIERLKLKCDILLSTSAFNINLRRYIKGMTYCGETSGASNLTIKNVPYHADVKKFGEALCNARAVDNGARDPGVSGEAGEGREAGGLLRKSIPIDVEFLPPPPRVWMSIHPEGESYADLGLSACSQ